MLGMLGNLGNLHSPHVYDKRNNIYRVKDTQVTQVTHICEGSDKKMTKTTPMKSIRKFCITCSGNMAGVRDCPDQACPLHIYRFGMGLTRYEKKRQWRASKKTLLINKEKDEKNVR